MLLNVSSHFTFSMLIFLLLLIPDSGQHCFHQKDCLSCTQHRARTMTPCRWCPLDRACHTHWSTRNPCLRHQSITQSNQCAPKIPHNVTYEPREAYKLALFSAIAYSDEPGKCMTAIFPDSDYKIDVLVLSQCDDFVLEYDKKCLALTAISHQNQEIIVAYRGTRGTEQLIEQTLHVLTMPKVHSAIGGKVQSYFHHINRELYKPVKQSLHKLLMDYPDYDVKFTGHSLGGTTASIASALLVNENIVSKDKVFLYTFGMPRVGDKHFAEAHDTLVPNSWRVVREEDVVTNFPFCSFGTCTLFNGPYHHKTKVLYSGPAMDINSEYIICEGNEEANWKCREKNIATPQSPFDRFIEKNHVLRSFAPASFKNSHTDYFGIRIGTYCIKDVLKQ